jgi:hypothetical protein
LLRDRTADENDQRGSKRGGFVDTTMVVVDRRLSRGTGRTGKESAAAQGDGREPSVVQLPANLTAFPSFECLPPNRDATNASGGIFGRGLLDRPRFRGDRV